jgi:O-antigen ligase
MAWSHTYLAGVEAIRWFLFSLIMWLCVNTRLEDLERRLPWGIHLGVTLASVWTVMQFLFDFNAFPQGPNPASTFVNRNFFAEFAIIALPYSVYLLLKSSGNWQTLALSSSIGLNLAALMMTGTRSALMALVVLVPTLMLIFFRFRKQLKALVWNRRKVLVAGCLVLGTTLALGLIPTGNPKLISEFGPINALERATGRAMSMMQADEYTTGSFSIRSVMWFATGRMIAANPDTGVGAGAWEVQAPLYQRAGTQLETDFYAHNEFLQLLAEYGVVGWLFLTVLFGYLAYSAKTTWAAAQDYNQQQMLLRATALASILMLLIVSNAGFPWRMASTGALFAINLGLLACSDARLGLRGRLLSSQVSCKANAVKFALAVSVACLMLTIYITQRAAYCERNLVRGIKLALTISKSGQPNNPYWNATKEEVIALMRSGIDLNRHYRKLTPMAADEMASWGDWKNALWIWESILQSRPNVVAIIANVSRAYLVEGNLQQAQEYLERAKRLQPTAPAVRTLNVMFLERTGQERQAAQEIKLLFKEGVIDYDLVYAAYLLGARTQDWALMIQALEIRIDRWPREAADGWLKLGEIYSQKLEIKDHDKALRAYRAALTATPELAREAMLKKIPPSYLLELSVVEN